MMSSPAPMKDETQGSGGRKNTSTARQVEEGLRCPRCDSPNTKFCYYNNYSLSQPRHFCKTCRRYWTKGGALRNVPIGGGCRKNKKLKSSSRLSSTDGGFSLSSLDFHSVASGLPFPRLNPHPPPFNLEGTSASLMNLSLNYPFNGGTSSMNVQSSLASSIESLSCINQDLHCKLQQQRLATLFGGDSNSTSLKDNATASGVHVFESQSQSQRLAQPILFQELEISRPEEICPVVGVNLTRDTSTEWFFGTSSYASVTPTPTTGGCGNGNNGNDNDNGSNWSGVRGWDDLQQQYSALP